MKTKQILSILIVLAIIPSLGFSYFHLDSSGSFVCGEYTYVTFENPPGFAWERYIFISYDGYIFDFNNNLPSYGYYRLYDPNIDWSSFTLGDGTQVDGSISSWSSYEQISGPQDCVQAPVEEPTNTRIPPTNTFLPPTFTFVPPSPTWTPNPPTATWTPLPTFTFTPTRAVPTSTSTQSGKIISTLKIENSATPQSRQGEVEVTPIRQLFSPGETTSIGVIDTGTFDCLPAATAMVLGSMEKQGLVSGMNADYATVRKAYRLKSPDANSGITWGDNVGEVVSEVSNNKVSNEVGILESAKWKVEITNELNSGFPVIAYIGNWNLLAAHWPDVHAHAIVINGLHDETVYYVDPWDGGNYSMTISDFENALGYYSSSYWFITFKVR